jgi:hypothetical protein
MTLDALVLMQKRRVAMRNLLPHQRVLAHWLRFMRHHGRRLFDERHHGSRAGPLTYICRGILDLNTTEIKVVRSRREDACASVVSAPQPEASRSSASNYLLMSSPRAAWVRSLCTFPSVNLTDRQLVARERHQWKRCIEGQQLRWVSQTEGSLWLLRINCD